VQSSFLRKLQTTPIRHIATLASAVALSAAPALAATPASDPFFTLHFSSNSNSSTNGGINGILGEATYSFTQATPSSNSATMSLHVRNLSSDPVTSSRLVSTGFDLPVSPPNPGTVKFSTPLDSAFTPIDPKWSVVFGDNIEPFGTFDACVTAATGCIAKQDPNDGLANNESTTVGTFSLTSPTLNTAVGFRDAFVALYNQYHPPTGGNAGKFNGAYFMRWKAIEGVNIGGEDAGSDKVWATSITTGGGGQAPTDSVPGPLPVFGAAAAFGYSRKLRRRLKAQSLTG
jgi:hypothetical protein